MDSSSGVSATQRRMRLEKQKEILQKKRQEKQAYEVTSLQARSFNSSVEPPRKSPRSVLRTPKRASRMLDSKEFAYDGPQAFQTGNPDLLDPPVEVIRVGGDKAESTSSIFGSPKSNGTPKSYQSIHLPSIRPVKLPLPKTPLTEGDQRSLFDSMETEDMDDAQAVKIRPNMERRKLKAAGGRRRPKPPPLRPYSATEITQRPRVKTNNLIDFGEDEETAMETSVASATPAFRSLTPSTSSAVSIQWPEKTKKSGTSPRRGKRGKKVSSRAGGVGKAREKRKDPAKKSSSITKRRPEMGSTIGKPKTEKATTLSNAKKKKHIPREDGTQSADDVLQRKKGFGLQGKSEKQNTGRKTPSPRKITHFLDNVEEDLDDFETPHSDATDKSIRESSASLRARAKHNSLEKQGLSSTGKSEIKKFRSPSKANEDANNDAGLKSAVARIFKAVDHMEGFIRSAAPQGMTVRCQITRDKHGIDGSLFPSYYLFLERREDRRRFFLLSARRKRRATTCTFLISMDSINIPLAEKSTSDVCCPSGESSGSDFAAGRRMIIGYLRSNFLGTQFVLSREATDSAFNLNGEKWNREIAAISYEPNLLGFKGPRKMTVLLRSENSIESPTSSKELSKYLTGLPESRDDSLGILELHNKKPMWNEETQSFVLNFHGRVTQASVKNFQLIDRKDESKILMQFGRVSNKHFTMDYSYPLSALQAFGIAISSLTGKLACE